MTKKKYICVTVSRAPDEYIVELPIDSPDTEAFDVVNNYHYQAWDTMTDSQTNVDVDILKSGFGDKFLAWEG